MKKNKSSRPFLLSIVTPAFNESRNLPLLYERLQKSLSKLKLAWEWIVVDDHSGDGTYRVMESIARKDKRVRVLRFAENRGSHLALACSLREAKGVCANLTQSVKAQERAIILPLYHLMTEAEQDQVLESLKKACG